MADGPYALDQNRRAAGENALRANGIDITGGSTVNTNGGMFNPSAYMAQPGTPGSQVYMGSNRLMNPGLAAGGVGMIGALQGKPTDNYENVRLLPTQWDEKQRRDFVSKGILYGIPGFDYNMGMPEIASAWDEMVKSAQSFSKPGAEWSPWDVMESYQKDPGSWGTVRRGDWLYDARTNEKVKYVGPRTKTTTSKNINLSSPEDVKALTTQMLTELLGRAPNAEELAKYRASINGFERENPELTTTTSTLNDQEEVIKQSSVTTGGASQAALGGIISEGAKKGPEYGKFQSGTTYFNALMQMIAGG